jgi:hypothetical protein
MNTQEPSFRRYLRTMQIIAVALIAGVVIFAGLALFLVWQRGALGQVNAGAGELPPLTLVSVVFLIAAGTAGLFVPRLILKGAAARLAKVPRDGYVMGVVHGKAVPISDAGFLLNARTSAMIVGMAMFEGVAFYAGIAYLLQARPLALGVLVVALAGLLSKFPTEGRVSAWLAEQQGVVDGLRERGG